MIIESALLCLALNVYHESRGESKTGQYAVAHVTMNRADSKTRVCQETFRRSQFSWTVGVSKTKQGWAIPRHLIPKDKIAWQRSLKVSRQVLDGKVSDMTFGAKFYHANYVKPRWSRHKSMRTSVVIGRHIFYVQRT